MNWNEQREKELIKFFFNAVGLTSSCPEEIKFQIYHSTNCIKKQIQPNEKLQKILNFVIRPFVSTTMTGLNLKEAIY